MQTVTDESQVAPIEIDAPADTQAAAQKPAPAQEEAQPAAAPEAAPAEPSAPAEVAAPQAAAQESAPQQADAAQADLTPEEVETQNRQYVAFRECMIGRGWDIPDPVPNEYGLLFPGFQAAASWEGPPGEDITSTDDVGECTDTAGDEVGADS